MSSARIAAAKVLGQEWGVPPRIINYKIKPLRTKNNLDRYRRDGFLWLPQAGIGRRILETADSAKFEARYVVEIQKVRAFMRALAAFGVNEVEQRTTVIKFMGTEEAERGKEKVGVRKENRGLSQEFVNHCSTIAALFSAAQFSGAALARAKEVFLAAIDGRSGEISTRTIAVQILTIAQQEGGCQTLIERAFSDEKKAIINFQLPSPTGMAQVALKTATELRQRCAELEALVVGEGAAAVYPARTREAQYTLCVALSVERIRRQAQRLVDCYHFPQEIFDADPSILTLDFSRTNNNNYAAAAYLKAVNQLIGKEQYDRALQLLQQAREALGTIEARREVSQAFAAYQAAIPLFLQAITTTDFTQAMQLLRAAYEQCLNFHGTSREEKALCAVLIGQLRSHAGTRIYEHYVAETKRFEREKCLLASQRQAAETAADLPRAAQLLLAEKRAARAAGEAKMWVTIANRVKERADCSAERFVWLLLIFFPVKNSFVISDAIIADLNQMGQAIIADFKTDRTIGHDACQGRRNMNDKRAIAIALKRLLPTITQVDFPLFLLYISLAQGVKRLVEQETARSFKAVEIDYLSKLAERWGVPFTRTQQLVIVNNGLAEAAINDINPRLGRGETPPPQYWQSFYLTLPPVVNPAVQLVCQTYSIPPFMLSDWSVTQVAQLTAILDTIKRYELLWLVQNGFKKEWLRQKQLTVLQSALQDMQRRVQKMQEVLTRVSVPLNRHEEIILYLLAGSNLSVIMLKNFSVLAQLYAALGKMKIAKRGLKPVVDKLWRDYDTRAACLALFNLAGRQVTRLIDTFDGVKREAMYFHVEKPANLVALALIPPQELSDYTAALAKLSFSLDTGGKITRYFPFRSRPVQLCLCVETDSSKMLAVAESLVREGGVTQAVFDADPTLVSRVYNGVAPTASTEGAAFLKAAEELIRQERKTEALQHLRRVVELLADYPHSRIRERARQMAERLQVHIEDKDKIANGIYTGLAHLKRGSHAEAKDAFSTAYALLTQPAVTYATREEKETYMKNARIGQALAQSLLGLTTGDTELVFRTLQSVVLTYAPGGPLREKFLEETTISPAELRQITDHLLRVFLALV